MGRKVRRSIRVNTSISSEANRKLRLLANSCNKPRATMAQLLIDYCLDNPFIVKEFQNKYNTVDAYRILPVRGDPDYENWVYAIGTLEAAVR